MLFPIRRIFPRKALASILYHCHAHAHIVKRTLGKSQYNFQENGIEFPSSPNVLANCHNLKMNKNVINKMHPLVFKTSLARGGQFKALPIKTSR